MARLKKQPKQNALADNFAERSERKKRRQYQQHDNQCRNELVDRAAADSGNGIRHCAVMDVADDQLFQDVQDEKERNKNDRPVERRPDQGLFLVAFAEMKRMSNAHEFGADQSLDGGKAERRKLDAVRLQDGGFEISQSRETDIEVRRDEQKLFQLVGRPLDDGCLRCGGIFHVDPPISSGHFPSTIDRTGASSAVFSSIAKVTLPAGPQL